MLIALLAVLGVHLIVLVALLTFVRYVGAGSATSWSISAPSRIRTCGLLLRRAPRRGNGRVREGPCGQGIAASTSIPQGPAWRGCTAVAGRVYPFRTLA
jgi:hypothetical protein